MRLVPSGFGAVSRAFADAVQERDSLLQIAAVRGNGTEVFLAPDSTVPARSSWEPSGPIGETLGRTGASVLVQALPSSPEAHARAVEEAVSALRSGVDVVTATKSHVLSHWRDLERAAVDGGSRTRISGAAGAALPTADMARVALLGKGCNAVRASPTARPRSSWMNCPAVPGWNLRSGRRSAGVLRRQTLPRTCQGRIQPPKCG